MKRFASELSTLADDGFAAAALNILPNAVIIIDKANRVIYANIAAEDLFAGGRAVLTRLTLDDLVGFGSPVVSLAEQVRRQRAPINKYDLTLESPRNDKRQVDVTGAPLTEAAAANGDQAVILMFQERSIARSIDQQMTQRGAARTVTGVAQILAHEIKNPLAGIRGASQLLQTTVAGEDKPLATLIKDETDRICRLVDEMEAFGDVRPPRLEPVNIHEVLERVKQVAESGFASSYKIDERYDPSLPPALGDKDKLVQVFLNLVKNSADAMSGVGKRHGRIGLSTAFRPGIRLRTPGASAPIALSLEVCVSDNGPGIPEDIRPHLFEPFVSSKPSGKGLGLALSAKIIGDHGGVIYCDAPSAGARFRILLPLVSANTP